MTFRQAEALLQSNESVRRFPLELGTAAPLLIRQEQVDLQLAGHTVRLLFASDLHLGERRSFRAIDQLSAAVAQTQPDLVLLGGDLVDSRRGLPLLQTCVQQLVQMKPVWAIAGNHDHWVGAVAVQQTVEQAGGHWLEGTSLDLFKEQARGLTLDGALHNMDRTQAQRILCAHNPVVFPQAIAAGYSLIFAGHLHGCQWVIGSWRGRLYPGAWFYRWNGLRFERSGATLLVSRGLGDTLPIRWNCPREVILCHIF